MTFGNRHTPFMHIYQLVEHAQSCLWAHKLLLECPIKRFFEIASFLRF